MSLTDLAVRKAKPREKPYKLSDSGGLHLAVQPGGSKLWRLKYRFAGKEKLLALGPYPLVSILEARNKREIAKKQLLDGIDPSNQRKVEKLAAEAEALITFGVVAKEYIEKLEAKDAAASTLSKTRWLLEDLAKSLTNRPIREITPAEILQILQRIEKTGRLETARRLRGTIGSVFRYAMVTLRADKDPTLPLHGALLAPKVVGRAAITDEKAFGQLLRSIDEYDGWPTITAALKFLALTCVRPGEVRLAARSEFDLKKGIWRIPAERMKMRAPHDVPLSKQALAVLEDVWPLSENFELVFPSVRSPRKSLSEVAFNAALRRMGYTKDEVTAHGFRVSASTILNERAYDPDVIESVLAHQDKNAIRRTYNRAAYWPQRVKLMQEWADLLDELKAGDEAAAGKKNSTRKAGAGRTVRTVNTPQRA